MMISGMPYPQNLETAKEIEAIVRSNGAIPATIAILDGIPRIGAYFSILYLPYCCLLHIRYVFCSSYQVICVDVLFLCVFVDVG